MRLFELWNLGHQRVRRSKWAEPGCYLRLPLRSVDGTRGVWGHLFSRQTQTVCELPTPQDILMLDNFEADETDDWNPWTGPLDPADTTPLASSQAR